MKKILISIAVVAVLFVGGLGIAMASAQAGNPPAADATPTLGGMLRNGWGGHGGMMGGFAAREDRPLHDLMITAWAEKLNLTVDELTAQLDDGLKMVEVAAAQGVSGEDFTSAWVEVHTTVWDEAVAQGLITADQAQFMKDRMQTRLDAGWVPGTPRTDCPMLNGGTPRAGGMGMSRGAHGGGMFGGGNR